MTSRHHDLIIKGVRACGLLFFLYALPFISLLPVTGCAPSSSSYHETSPESLAETRVVLQPGDEIELKFPHWKELNDTQVIRPDGFITLQLIDSVRAQGLTPEELDKKLTELYTTKIKDPVISVVVRSLVDQRIYVGGEVNNPGLVTLRGKVNTLQAVLNAGGFKETARMDHVIVIRQMKGGKAVPYKVDLSRALFEADSREAFLLRPSDVVYVPKTTIANLDKFVDQYIAKLFLFRGIGVGFTYDMNDGNRVTLD